MPLFTGTLRSNEIFSALFNMIISQQVFADNVKGTYATLADRFRVDGSMYGDTKLYYSTDVLESSEWGADAEAANLLELHRPDAPKCQAIVIDRFRQIALTVDNYLSKRAWGDEGAFSNFTSVMLGWIGVTKRVYDSTLVNTFVGTTESAAGKQTQSITMPSVEGNPEAENRLGAQTIAEKIANIFVELRDISRDYNDWGQLRSIVDDDVFIVWNSDYYNKILKIDLPNIYHKEDLLKEGVVLPARYFGTVNAAAGTTSATNQTIRSLIEIDYGSGSSKVHLFPGDLLPNSTAYLANETYTQDETVICKILHKRSVPFMSAFEVGTSFYNPKSLTENHYLTFGHNSIEYLKQYPFITLKAVEAVAAASEESK